MAHLKGKKTCPPNNSNISREEIIEQEHNRKTHFCEYCQKYYAHVPTSTSHVCKTVKVISKVKEEPKKRGRKKKEVNLNPESISEQTMREAMRRVLIQMADKL